MNEIIEKIAKFCLEIDEKNENCYNIVVGRNEVNKVVDMLKGVGVELHFNYGSLYT